MRYHNTSRCDELRISQEPVNASLVVVTSSVRWGLEYGGCSRMHGWSSAVYYGIEPVVIVSGVSHSADRAVRFHQAVFAPHHVTIAFLPLLLDVSGMRVIDTVVETVLGVCLGEETCCYCYRNRKL